jgi:hypothetical protein
MCVEVSTIWRSLGLTVFGIYQDASTIMRKAFDWNVLEFLCWKWKQYPRVVFRKSRLVWVWFYIWGVCCLWKSFDLRPSNQYSLVRVIPSCFHFAKMCLCQVSLLSRCSPRYLTSSWGSCTLFIWTGEGGGQRFSSCSECYVDRIGSIGFHSLFLKPVLDCE